MSDASFLWVVAGSTLVDAAAASAALLLPWLAQAKADRAPIGLPRILAAALVAAGVFLVKLVILICLGISTFGIIHLIYADVIVAVPAIGSLLILGSRRTLFGAGRLSTTPLALGAGFLSLVLVPVGWYATWVEPFRLKLETAHVLVPEARAADGAIRIGVLADLQTRRVTDYERNAVARLMALKPDLIVVPGDLFQGSPADFLETRDALRDLLAQLAAPAGVYLVLGDFDDPGANLESLLRSTRIKLLANEAVRVAVGDRQVTIGVVELDVTTPAARKTVQRLESDPGSDDFRILVAHRPDVAFEMHPRSRIDLVIAGHTHGGQIVVPGFGPPMTLTNVPRGVAAGGLHRLSGNPIYVSRGVGCERGQAPRIRFLCPPEISLLTLDDAAAN